MKYGQRGPRKSIRLSLHDEQAKLGMWAKP